MVRKSGDFERWGVAMIRKQMDCKKQQVLVTFDLPASIWADDITVIGDFNNWDPKAHPLSQSRRNEGWHITLTLEPNQTYRFCYLIDGQRWCNDSQADAWSATEDGRPCSIILTGIKKGRTLTRKVAYD